MTFDEIRTALRDAEAVPTAALIAAPAHLDTLAGEIYPLVDQLARGTLLIPAQASYLFYGLHVLAAAGRADLYPHLIKLARLPEDELNLLFLDRGEITLAQMLLSVFDSNAKALFHLLEHADLSTTARWGLFDVLARLTFDGRIPRADTEAFLTRFEASPLAAPDDLSWWSWQDAVCRLGLTSLEPALRRVRGLAANETGSPDDLAEDLAVLAHAAAHPTDSAAFDEAEVRPITDAVAALAWLTTRNEALLRYAAEERAKTTASHATRDRLALLEDNAAAEAPLVWLARFLDSRQVPQETMPIEVLDGYLTALAIGPVAVTVDALLPDIFGQEDRSLPAWADDEQSAYFVAAVTDLKQSIEQRARASEGPEPLIAQTDLEEYRGMEWADGFSIGVSLHDEAWTPIFEHKRAGEAVHRIFDLAPALGEEDDQLSLVVRRQRIAELPALLKQIAAYWRDPKAVIPPLSQPARSTKIGRNDPCPCGSGEKFKKCHGAPGGTGLLN
jgi:uncharacterized protein